MPLPASRGLSKTSEYAQGFGKMPYYRLIWQAYLGSVASVPFLQHRTPSLPLEKNCLMVCRSQRCTGSQF